MALEIISEPTGAPTGSFTPRADQGEHRSAFGLISTTTNDGGFISGHTLQNGVVSGDGRRALKFKEFKGTDGKPHEVRFNGRVLREFVCDITDAEEMDRYSGGLSNAKMQSYLSPVIVRESSTQVGIQKSGEIAEASAPLNHQY